MNVNQQANRRENGITTRTKSVFDTDTKPEVVTILTKISTFFIKVYKTLYFLNFF